MFFFECAKSAILLVFTAPFHGGQSRREVTVHSLHAQLPIVFRDTMHPPTGPSWRRRGKRIPASDGPIHPIGTADPHLPLPGRRVGFADTNAGDITNVLAGTQAVNSPQVHVKLAPVFRHWGLLHPCAGRLVEGEARRTLLPPIRRTNAVRGGTSRSADGWGEGPPHGTPRKMPQ